MKALTSSQETTKEKKLLSAMRDLVRLLSRRDHSARELKQKLQKRFATEIVEEVIEKAKEKKWLKTEMELAQQWTETLSRKKKGQKYIQAYLLRKGLPIIAIDPEKEMEKAYQLVVAKFGENINTTDITIKNRVYRFLKNRGFKESLIKKVIYEKS